MESHQIPPPVTRVASVPVPAISPETSTHFERTAQQFHTEMKQSPFHFPSLLLLHLFSPNGASSVPGQRVWDTGHLSQCHSMRFVNPCSYQRLQGFKILLLMDKMLSVSPQGALTPLTLGEGAENASPISGSCSVLPFHHCPWSSYSCISI